MSGIRTLVTGAAGLVGGAVSRRLAEEGSAVVATDIREAVLPRGLAVVPVDLVNRSAVEHLINNHRIERIIHCGGVSGPMVAAGDPDRIFRSNIVATLNVLESARVAGVPRAIVLSTAGVYGRQANLAPVTEEAPLNAVDAYACSKIASEAIATAYRAEHGLAVTVLRLSSIYGPGRTTACFIRDLAEAAMLHRPIAIDRSGTCRRQFVHIDDTVAAILAAATLSATDHLAYNISGGTWLTEEEIFLTAASVLPGLRLAEERAPPRRLDGVMGPLDCSRANAMFGYVPRMDLPAGIKAYAPMAR